MAMSHAGWMPFTPVFKWCCLHVLEIVSEGGIPPNLWNCRLIAVLFASLCGGPHRRQECLRGCASLVNLQRLLSVSESLSDTPVPCLFFSNNQPYAECSGSAHVDPSEPSADLIQDETLLQEPCFIKKLDRKSVV